MAHPSVKGLSVKDLSVKKLSVKEQSVKELSVKGLWGFGALGLWGFGALGGLGASLSPLALGIAKASLTFRVKRSGKFLWAQSRIAVLPTCAAGISKALNDLTLWPRRLF